MGAPRRPVDEEALLKFAGMNFSLDELAAALNTSKNTLLRRYGTLIERGRANGRGSLKRRMWECAMGFTEPRTVLIRVKKTSVDANGAKKVLETSETKTYEHKTEPNVGAQIWLSKQMLGYSDKVEERIDTTSKPSKVTVVWQELASPKKAEEYYDPASIHVQAGDGLSGPEGGPSDSAGT